MEYAELKQLIRRQLFNNYDRIALSGGRRAELTDTVDDMIGRARGVRLDAATRARMAEEIVDDLVGYGPLQRLMTDPEVSEIMVNGPHTIYVERGGTYSKADIAFEDEAHLRGLVDRLAAEAERRIDENRPYVDLGLADGTRVNVVLPPVAVGGPFVTLRRAVASVRSLEELVRLETLDVNMARFLWACTLGRINILFSGATGSGKTTLLEILSGYLDAGERIVTIEDTLELKLRQEHVVRMLTRPPNLEGKGEITIRDLFINSLRMRPTRIILGEIRGQEALDYLNALNSGHRGTLAVIHAASPEEAILRMENLSQYAGIPVQPAAIRSQIARGLDVIVQIAQMADGSRKVVRVTEVIDLDEDDMVELEDLFVYEEEGLDEGGRVRGRFRATGAVPEFYPNFKKLRLDIERAIFDPPSGD